MSQWLDKLPGVIRIGNSSSRRIRWQVIIVACMYTGYVGFMLCKSSVSLFAPTMKGDLGLATSDFGVIFAWAYGQITEPNSKVQQGLELQHAVRNPFRSNSHVAFFAQTTQMDRAVLNRFLSRLLRPGNHLIP